MADPRPVVVTGAAGFIGRALIARLAAEGVPVIALTRAPMTLAAGIAGRPAGALTAASDWPALLAGARTVVHLASRAHAPIAAAEEARWITAEAQTAAALARAARSAGIERLVFLSSIKVQGEATAGAPFRAADPPAPADVYGRAKLAIEAAMRETGAPLAVLRPPLVYGPEVKANFRALLRLVDRGLPLPLATIDNRRSLIFLDNLVDLILAALTHPAAVGGVFLARDEEEPSTPALIRQIAAGLGRPARLFPCPPTALRVAARLLGQTAAIERLTGSLSLDDSATRQRLDWRPRVPLAAGIAATCRWYRMTTGGAGR